MKKTLTILCALLMTMFARAQTGTQFMQGEGGTLNKRVSPNGKYLVGSGQVDQQWGMDLIRGYDSFIKDIETCTTEWITSYSSYEDMGLFYDVNDQRVVCGVMKDEDMCLTITDLGETHTLPLNVAAVWKDGKAIKLEYGKYTLSDFSYFPDGTVATAISNDSKIVVGYVMMGNGASIMPCAWVQNATTGNYENVEYAVPENTLTAVINDVSGDGKVAVGRINFKGKAYMSYPCYWPNPNECVVIKDEKLEGLDQTLSGNAFAISNNGRFIGIVTDGKEPMLYSVDQKQILRRLGTYRDVSSVSIGGVSDIGDVYGEYVYSGMGRNRPFWYSMNDLVKVDFDYFIYLYGGEAQIPYKFSYWANENLSFSGISADGKVIAGNDVFGSPWILCADTYIAMIPPTLENDVKANATGLGEITVRFDRNQFEGHMSYDAAEYVLFRNGNEVASFNVSELDAADKRTVTFVDKEVNSGTYYYSVAILYKDAFDDGKTMLSPKTNEVSCFIESNFEFPLIDDFETQSLAYNDWTVQRDYGETDYQNFGCIQYFGLNGSAFCNTSSDQTIPYSYSLVSRHIDAKDRESVYISFARKWQYVNSTDWNLDKDTLSLEVSSDGYEWYVAKDFLIKDIKPDSWSFEYIDITPYAAGKVFQVRFRLHGQAEAMMNWAIDNLRIDEKPQHAGVKAVGMVTEDDKFRLIWKNSMDAYQLSYLANPTKNAEGLCVGNEGKEMIAVNKFEPTDLKLYDGKYITSITTEVEKFESVGKTPIRVAVVVYENGKLIRDQEIDNNVFNTYTVFKLDEPVRIDASKELMVGLKLLEHGAEQMPLVYHNTNSFIDGKSNLYSVDGGNTWLSLADFFRNVPEHETDGNACWLISANVTDTPDAESLYYDTNQYAYEIYKNGQKYSQLLTHFLEPGFTDESSVQGDVYEVRAFYLDGTVSELSNTVKNSGSTGIDDVVTDGVADKAYSVDGNELNVNGSNAKVEIYNSNGVKVYEGSGRNVGLDAFGHGVFVLKVYAADGSSTVHKFMF